MSRLSNAVIAAAATLFVIASAAVNATFLSSLARTPLEGGVLLAISLAADTAKLVLPIAVMAALASRAYGRVLIGGTLLTLIVLLSIASGAGFASATRDGSAAVKDAELERAGQLRRALAALDQRRSALPSSREAGVVEAAIKVRDSDPRWRQSQECRQQASAALRGWCNGALGLDIEKAAALARIDLSKDAESLHKELRGLGSLPSATSDPQAGALALLLGVPPANIRTAFAMLIAMILEIGSIGLVVLASPKMQAPTTTPVFAEPAAAAAPAEVPPQNDRSHWLRRRGQSLVLANGAGGHDAG